MPSPDEYFAVLLTHCQQVDMSDPNVRVTIYDRARKTIANAIQNSNKDLDHGSLINLTEELSALEIAISRLDREILSPSSIETLQKMTIGPLRSKVPAAALYSSEQPSEFSQQQLERSTFESIKPAVEINAVDRLIGVPLAPPNISRPKIHFSQSQDQHTKKKRWFVYGMMLSTLGMLFLIWVVHSPHKPTLDGQATSSYKETNPNKYTERLPVGIHFPNAVP